MAAPQKEPKGLIIRLLDFVAFTDAVRGYFNESLIGYCLRDWRRRRKR